MRPSRRKVSRTLLMARSREDLLRHAPAMDLAGAVVDAEGTHVLENAHHHGLGGDALAAEDLHRAVHDSPYRLGAHGLGAARFEIALAALVQNPGGMPDVQARGGEVHVVVGEHEAHALVLAQGLAEGL